MVVYSLVHGILKDPVFSCLTQGISKSARKYVLIFLPCSTSHLHRVTIMFLMHSLSKITVFSKLNTTSQFSILPTQNFWNSNKIFHAVHWKLETDVKKRKRGKLRNPTTFQQNWDFFSDLHIVIEMLAWFFFC